MDLAVKRMKKIYTKSKLDSQKEFIEELAERMGVDGKKLF